MKQDTEIAKEFYDLKDHYDSIKKKKKYATAKLARFCQKRDKVRNASIKESGGGTKKAADDNLIDILHRIVELEKEIDGYDLELIEWESALETAKEGNPVGWEIYELHIDQGLKQDYVGVKKEWSARTVRDYLTDFTDEMVNFLKK